MSTRRAQFHFGNESGAALNSKFVLKSVPRSSQALSYSPVSTFLLGGFKMSFRKMIVASALACLALMVSVPMHAQSSAPLTVTAMVESQVCLSKDFAQVTFTAVATSDVQPVGFRWDLNNDNKPDTARSTDPTAIQVYGDEAPVTVKVSAINKNGERASNVLSFTTIKCN